MAGTPLDNIEWHDLPITALSLNERGIELVVGTYAESMASYAQQLLRIGDADTLEVNLTGLLSPNDLGELEVSDFEYVLSADGRISGTIGILPGQAGYWTISFGNAVWSMTAFKPEAASIHGEGKWGQTLLSE